jgi:hypothetical protein
MENVKHFPTGCQRQLEEKLALPISQLKNRRGQTPGNPTKTLRHSSPPKRTGYSGAVFIKTQMSLRGPAHFVIVSVSETISVLKMCGINSAEAISSWGI